MSSDVVTVSLQLRWGDMDVVGHVNNTAIARLFEESRVRASQRLLRRRDDTAGADALVGGGMVIARQEIEFLAQVPYGTDDVTCEVWLSRVGRSSFDYSARLIGTDGTHLAQAETTLVRIDREGRSEALDADVAEAMRERVQAPLPLRSRSASRA